MQRKKTFKRLPLERLPHRWIITVVLTTFLLYPPSHASAKPNEERTVSGRVTDRHREPLAGAIVMVHNQDTLSVISYITGRDGEYEFKHLLPDDNYEVFATYRGVRSKSRRMSKFDSKIERRFTLVITLP